MVVLRHPNIASLMKICANPAAIVTGKFGLYVEACFPLAAFVHAGDQRLVSVQPSDAQPSPLCLAEFYSRGSLADVLDQAARDPAAAAQLTWRRRLGMVRSVNAAWIGGVEWAYKREWAGGRHRGRCPLCSIVGAHQRAAFMTVHKSL